MTVRITHSLFGALKIRVMARFEGLLMNGIALQKLYLPPYVYRYHSSDG